MTDGLLTFDHGRVALGDQEINGILKNQSIRGAVRFDEAEQDGVSGKVKTPLGWEDADITLTMELLTDEIGDCYDKLTGLNALFAGHDNGGNPQVYDLVNAHAIARGIHQVVFAGLDSSESDADDVISVSLHFMEHNPPIVRVEEQAAATPVANQEGGSPEPDAELLQDNLTIDLS